MPYHIGHIPSVEIRAGETPQCDFCNVKNPKHSYKAHDIRIANFGGIEHMSRGNWAACDECKKLIDSDNREGLLSRSMQTLDLPNKDNTTREVLRLIHGAFFDSKQ